ncbi:ANTAR domain-containing protein [Actinokineospora soli]|uniref:ANTAR domain-containing protein n=1 Tax=Actinokineospora soli TaxID=1048753 RepID=A0ABW2TKN0_9PSEU
MTGAVERVLTLAQELVEVSRLAEDDDVSAILSRFVTRLAKTVPGVAEATITVRTPDGTETVAAVELNGVGEAPASLDPIAEALQYREPRRVDDTASDQRWPEFSAHLVSRGYRSVLALPIPTRRSTSAVLTLYSRTPHQFDETAYDIVLLLALHAGAVFDNAQLYHDSRSLVDQLNTALDTRQTIGQAQGLLMRHYHTDAETGFRLLRGASQNTNSKLRQVAQALVSAQDRGDLSAALRDYGLGEPDKTPTPTG